MKKYIGFLCIALLFLSGCKKDTAHKRAKIPFFNDTKKKNRSTKQSSRKTQRALQENLNAFALEQDTVSDNTFSLADKDMNLFAFDDSTDTSTNATQANTPLFKWDDLEADNSKDQFQNLYFEFDKYDLQESERPKLAQDVELAKKEQCVIQDGSNKTIIVEGHSCHSAGSAAYNLALSEKRARTIAQEFMNKGIDKENLKIAPRGQEMPLVHGGDKKEQAKNRRVEVFAIDAAPKTAA